jgi:tetratricopeptide (TPR) repeat protein
MSLAQLGGQDLSRSFLSSVEHGRSRISVRALSIVADHLGLPLSYFLDSPAESREATVQLALSKAETAIRQQQPEEALRLLDEREFPDEHAAEALYLRGWALADAGQPREAIPVLEDALARCKKHEDPRQHLLIEYCLAVALYSADDYDEALIHYRAVMDGASGETGDPILMGKSTVAIGHIHYVHRNFPAALNYYARARELFGSINDLDNLASVYTGLSRVYEHRGDLQNALRYSRMSVGIYETQHNRRHAAHELNNMAARYKDLGKLDEALDCANRAVEWARQTHAPDVEALARSTLAAIHFERDDLDASQGEAERAQALAPASTDLGAIDATVVLAKVLDRRGEYDRADQLFTSALHELDTIGHSTAYADTALAYSLSLERRGDLSQALKFALEAAQVRATQPA